MDPLTPAPAASVRVRIARNLLVLLAFVVVMLCVAVLTLKRLGSTLEVTLNDNIDSILACIDMDEALERQDDVAFSLSHDAPPEVGNNLAAMRGAFMLAWQREAANSFLPGEAMLVEKVRRDYQLYHELGLRLLAPDLDRITRRRLYHRELRPVFFELQSNLQKIIALNHAQIERANVKTKRTARALAGVILGASIAALAMAALVAWRLMRSLVQPLTQLTASIHAVEAGDLSHPVELPTVAELQVLALAFNRMLAQLGAYRQQTQGELARARELAQATVECMLDPVIVCNSEEQVVLASGAAVERLAVRQGALATAASSGNPIVHEVVRACREVLSSGRPVLPQSLSQSVRGPSNEPEQYYLVRAWPLRAEPGAALRAIAVAQDITRFRRIDALKNDVVATVSHEFKTPLTSLLMATHLLLDAATGPLTDMQRDVVQSARTDAERLRRMVEELLDLVRIESEASGPRRKQVHPTGLLQEVAQAHKGLASSRGVAVSVDPDEHDEPVWVPDQISIVLANLLINAITHSPAGGCVTLKAAQAPRWVRWAVLDSGPGIEQERLSKILSGAVSSDAPLGPSPSKRHGLGLTIARSIVRQYGGELSAASTPGSGSLFIVSLPTEE